MFHLLLPKMAVFCLMCLFQNSEPGEDFTDALFVTLNSTKVISLALLTCLCFGALCNIKIYKGDWPCMLPHQTHLYV